MTVAEMHIRFKVGVDKVNSFSNPQFEPEEIDVFLNRAQERFVKTRYGQFNNKQTSFEETQKRTDDLRQVVSTFTTTTFYSDPTNVTNGQYCSLPADYWFMLYEKGKVSFQECGATVEEWVKVLPVSHDMLNHILQNPFKKPGNRLVLRLLHGSGRSELVLATSAVLSEYFIRYVKKPIEIDFLTGIDCGLSEHTHEEIVNDAISIALEAVEQPRYQTNVNELNKQE